MASDPGPTGGHRPPDVSLHPPSPNCVKCGASDFGFQWRAFGGLDGVLVYCRECGGVVNWAPRPK